MAPVDTQCDLSKLLELNINDPADLHCFQLAVQKWCEDAVEDENFISEEEAERLSQLVVHPQVWPSVMFSMPALTVTTGQVPDEGGGAKGILQRAFKKAGLLENDELEANPNHQIQALFNRAQHRLIMLLGSQYQDKVYQLVEELYKIDKGSDVRKLLEDDYDITTAPKEGEEAELSEDVERRLLDVEDFALRDRFLAGLITIFGETNPEAVEHFVREVCGKTASPSAEGQNEEASLC